MQQNAAANKVNMSDNFIIMGIIINDNLYSAVHTMSKEKNVSLQHEKD